MPAGLLIVDNLAQGGLAAPLDPVNGTICGCALQKHDRLGVIYFNQHPTTGQVFSGFQVPMWKEAVELAIQAHHTFPSIHFVGWDIAILPKGPVLVEGNALFDTDLTVLPHGLALADTPFIPTYNHHWKARQK